MTAEIMGSGERDDVRLYVDLAFGNQANIDLLGAGLGERLLEEKLFLERPKAGETLRIIDIGCGGGWITLSALEYCLTRVESGLRLELVALDPNKNGMLGALRSELCRRKAVADHPDSAHWKWQVNGSIVDVTICATSFEKYLGNPPIGQFDAVFSFFTLQRLHDWRDAVRHHADLVKQKGLLVLSEMHGDYAGWSNRFDKILASDVLPHSPARQNYIRFIRRYHDLHRDKGMHLVFGSISASDLGPAFEVLNACGLCISKNSPPIQIPIRKCPIDADNWLRGLGLIENRSPLFTFPVRQLKESDKKAIAADMKRTASSCTNGLEALDQVHFSIFRHMDERPSLIPEPAIGNNLRRIFSGVPSCDIRKEEELRRVVWEPDLLALVSHGVLDDVPLSFLLHHSLSSGDWVEATPFHCRSHKLLTKVAIYYYLTVLNRELLGISGRTTQFLYQKLPKKCAIQTVFDFPSREGKAEFEFEPDGRSLATLKISVPRGILTQAALEVCENAAMVGETKLNERFFINGATEIPARLGGGKLINNKEFSDWIPGSLLEKAAAPLLALARADKLYDNDALDGLRKKLSDAFSCLGGLLGEEVWKRLGDDWEQWLPKVFAIQSLLGVAELLHLPSRDALEYRDFPVGEGQGEETEKAKIEISTGGVILFLDERSKAKITARSKALILDLINLRNGSLYVAAHREEATHRVLEQARKAAAAAIMARNMSHNLGSHPLARLAVSGGISKYREEVSSEIDPQKKYEVSDRDIERFTAYVRARMDFIAGISTLTPVWGVNLSLDELVNDFSGEAYLLSTLTELGRRCEVVKVGDGIRKLRVMLPHARMGQQALYSIFENVLRNSEKHGRPGGVDAARIMVIASRCPNLDIVHLDVIDKGSPLNRVANDWNTAKLKTDGTPLTLKELRAHLAEPFYLMEGGYSRGEINPKYWGLKEMKISAAFLRLRPAFEVDSYGDVEGTRSYKGTKGAPWIKPFAWSEPARPNQHFLGWRIRLLRPRPALLYESLVDTVEVGGRKELAAAWQELGYGLATEHTLVPLANESERRRSFPHRFLVLPLEAAMRVSERGTENRSLNYLPTRQIAVGCERGTAGLPKDWGCVSQECWDRWQTDPDRLEARLFEAWTDALAENAGGTNTGSFPLVLAIDSGGDTHLNIDALPRGLGGAGLAEATNTLFAHQEAIAKTARTGTGSPAAIALSEFGQRRIIAYGRYHGSVPGGQNSSIDCDKCMTLGICNKHRKFWGEAAQCYNAVRSTSPQLELAKTARHDRTAALSLIEAGLVWIVIIDERIAERTKPKKKSKLKPVDPRRPLAWAGIFVLDVESASRNLHSRKFDISVERMTEQLGSLSLGLASRPGRLIVTCHLGLLSTQTDQRKYLRMLQAAFEEKWNIPVEIIVHSGRGKTGEMKGELAGYKFLEFSSLDALTTIRDDKVTLVELFLSLRE